jgi:hypothetical protein
VQLMGLSEALGYAIGSGCVDYLAVGLIMSLFVLLPLLSITYILHRGVAKHARYVPAEGNFFSRFKEAWNEGGEKKYRWFLCIPYGRMSLALRALSHANIRGDWEEVKNEHSDGGKRDGKPPSFWEDPWSRFIKRFGPMFADFTAYSW